MKLLSCVLLLISLTGHAHSLNRPQPDGKIVGGVSVDILYFPYQVSVQYLGQHFCGGAIISPNSVATAAHCSPTWSGISNFSIQAGTTYVGYGGVNIPLSSYIRHPNYNASSQDYDICVLKLSQYLTYGNTIQPIALATALPPDNSYGIVSGWGRTAESGALAFQLQAVSIPTVNRVICGARYSFAGFTSRMFCAGNWVAGGQDACQGDSGGPFVYAGQLLGIVSWGVGCARPYYPGVYSSVPNLRGFLIQNMQ